MKKQAIVIQSAAGLNQENFRKDYMKHILVVDDDRRLRDLLCRYLVNDGFKVTIAKDAEEAKATLNKARIQVDIIVLDIMMPGQSGVELTRELRGGSDIPIIMLTAMGEVENRIEGLESGADDYLVKPFEPRELSLRIRKLLARSMKKWQPRKLIKFGEFIFNMQNGDLKKNGEMVRLSSSELSLFTIFVKNLGKQVSREELSRLMNGISERSVDVQVTRLRKKIESDPKKPRYLETAWGEGYILRSRE